MRLKYVGLKQSSEAFKAMTGIVWLQGAEHEVKDEHAKAMLAHPDVFALAEEPREALAEEVVGLADALPDEPKADTKPEPKKGKPGPKPKARA